MFKRRLILLLAGLALLTIFFLLPENRQWSNTVLSYWKDFQLQKNDLDREARMSRRFGNYYTYSVMIADSLNKKGEQNALLLMPPTSYFKKMGMDYRVPVPPVFYYFTGLKITWANNKDAITADWYVRVSNGKIIIDRVTDRKALQDTITAFQKLGVHL